jgi:predicted nuclease with TOPRIM domain
VGLDPWLTEKIIRLGDQGDRIEGDLAAQALALTAIRSKLEMLSAQHETLFEHIQSIEGAEAHEEETSMTFLDKLQDLKDAQDALKTEVEALPSGASQDSVNELRDHLNTMDTALADIATVAAEDKAIDTGDATTGAEVLRQLTGTDNPPPPSP